MPSKIMRGNQLRARCKANFRQFFAQHAATARLSLQQTQRYYPNPRQHHPTHPPLASPTIGSPALTDTHITKHNPKPLYPFPKHASKAPGFWKSGHGTQDPGQNGSPSSKSTFGVFFINQIIRDLVKFCCCSAIFLSSFHYFGGKGYGFVAGLF